jgi:DNA-directed RNA polymerase specialized sigma24 family protein
VVEATIQRRIRLRRDIEQLVALAAHLAIEDRLLVQHVFGSGVPVSHIALITGLPPRNIQRRLQSLLTRLNDPLFRFFVAHADLLDKPTRAVGRLVVCEGHSMRQAARHLRLSLYQVRQHMHAIRTRAGL